MKGLLLLLAIGFILFLLWDGAANYESATVTPEENEQIRGILGASLLMAVLFAFMGYSLAPDSRRGG